MPAVETEMESVNEMKDVSVDMSENKDNIISRVAGLPMVNSAIGQVTNMYTKTKEYNGLVKYTLEAAEKSVVTVASAAMPVVNTLEKPIGMANDFACNQMDKLEEAYPVITQPSDKVYSSVVDGSKRVWDNTKSIGTRTIDNLMNTKVGQAVSASVDISLSMSEIVVDHCLPPDAVEREEDMAEASKEKTDEEKQLCIAPVQRVVSLTGKVRHRIYVRAMAKLQTAQKRSQETVEKLHYTVNLIEYAKANIDTTNQKVRDQMNSAQETLWTTWDDWTTEDGQGEEGGQESQVKEKTVSVIRGLTKRLTVASGKLATAGMDVLPETVTKQLTKAKDTAEDLYDSMKQVKVLNDLPSSLLDQAKDRLNQVSEAMLSVTEYVVNSKALQWLVPDKVKQVLDVRKPLTNQGNENTPAGPDENYSAEDDGDSDDDDDDDDYDVDIDDEFHANEQDIDDEFYVNELDLNKWL
ncbi:perilipin-2-like isoform X2 [Glandiceps talaboti]